MLNLMRIFSLVIHQLVRHIESLTKDLRRLENQFISFFYETNHFVPNLDDNDVSPGIGDKIKDLSINDSKNEVSPQIQEESKV